MLFVEFYKSFYLSRRAYLVAGVMILLMAASWFTPFLALAARLTGYVLLGCIVLDTFLLYGSSGRLEATREAPERFSNGDLNTVTLQIHNTFPFPLRTLVIDELPIRFQDRNWKRYLLLRQGSTEQLDYQLKPMERGIYKFGRLHLFIQSPLGIVRRRCTFNLEQDVEVYPSYIHLRKYQLETQGTTQDAGRQRLRRTGLSLEFEQIKEYVPGDDYRTINWKASARKGQLMINNYVEERSQPIYCVIDKGRLMKMPFQGMTLLDYAVNASLALINVALNRQDKAGLITFSRKVDQFLAADRKAGQMETVLEALYNVETEFKESDFETLYAQLRNRLKQRSLLILFTNFESIHSLRRQLPYLRAIGRYHLLITVFFDNTELHALQRSDAHTLEDVYIKTIAERFLYEKKLMAKEMAQYGILSVFTSPENLTVRAINKYLEVKARQAL